MKIFLSTEQSDLKGRFSDKTKKDLTDTESKVSQIFPAIWNFLT